MTWIKICGNTNLEDARFAANVGADAVGFVFAGTSPRRIDPAAAADIVSQLPPAVEKVGVFVNERPSRVREIVRQVGLTAVQLHGDESIDYAEQLFPEKEHPKIYRAFSMKTLFSVTSGAAFLRTRRGPAALNALIVDSGSEAQRGGTGLTFDWTRAQPFISGLRRNYKVVVAGGLTAENVQNALSVLRPWGVDTASGVEREPGRKDHDKIRSFIAAVRSFK